MSRFDEQSAQALGTLVARETETSPARPAGCGQTRLGADPSVQWDANAALAALSDSVPCGVLLFGSNGELLRVNGHLADTLGYKKEELFGLGCFTSNGW